ncbi:MAG: HAD hydrolase-like protein [Bryobacterales bacterium]|nr:HAD hydrolase-like protein [Bryobacterales bacterium]
MPAHTRTLFTDIGGVLLTNGWDHQSRALAVKTFHLDAADYDDRHHLIFDLYEAGVIPLDVYIDRTVLYRPRPFTRDDFRRFMFEQSQPLDGMFNELARLKRRHGLQVAAISNEGRELTEYRIRTFALDTVIDFFVSSCFTGLRKPDPRIFRMALDLAQASPAESVYLDDRALFVETAARLGFGTTIQYQSVPQTLAALAAAGLGD